MGRKKKHYSNDNVKDMEILKKLARSKRANVLYSVTTTDEYEFPLFIGNIYACALFDNTTPSSIRASIYHAHERKTPHTRYHRLYSLKDEEQIE